MANTFASNLKTIVMDQKTVSTVNKMFINRNINTRLKGKLFQIKKIPFIVWNNSIWDINYADTNSVYINMLNYIKENKNNPLMKKMIISAWNNYGSKYTNIILNHNYNKCDDVYNYYNKIWNIKLLYSNKIINKWYSFINKMNEQMLWKTIACSYNYIFPEWYKLTELKTRYIPYRYKNITMVINKDFIKVLNPNDSFSTVDEVLRNKKYKFVEGKAIVDGKIKEVEAGWACGISTIIYQTLLQHLQYFKILKRRPHSAWYNFLYWKMLWLDSTIYDMWRSSIDLKFRNNSMTTVILQGYNKKLNGYWFEYWIKVFAPYLKDSYAKEWKITKIKTNQIHKYKDRRTWKEKEEKITYKCVNNFIYSVKNNILLKKIRSCYKFVNQAF